MEYAGRGYLKLILEEPLTLHPDYSDNNRIVFQQPLLPLAVQQYGIKKCKKSIMGNLPQILERTREQYKFFDMQSQIGNNTFQRNIELTDEALEIFKGVKEGEITIFGLGENGRVEISLKYPVKT